MIDKPPDNPTTKLPSDEIQTGLLNKLVGMVTSVKDDVRAMGEEMTSEIKEVRADVALISSAQKNTQDELRIAKADMAQRFEALETRATSSSLRVRDVTSGNLEAASQLAQERAARESLAKDVAETKSDLGVVKQEVVAVKEETKAQTAILARLDRVASNPVVKEIAKAVGTGLVFWLASKGIHP